MSNSSVVIITPMNVGLAWLRNHAVPTVLSQNHKDWTWYVVSEGDPEPGIKEYIQSIDQQRVFFATVPRVLPPGIEAPNYDKVDGVNAVLAMVKEKVDYIAFLEPGYVWSPDHLARLIYGMNHNGTGDFAYSRVRWDMGDRHVGFKGFAFNRRRVLNRDYIPASCVVYRRQARHGYYFQKTPNHPPFHAFLRQYLLSNPNNGFMWLDETHCYNFEKCSDEYVSATLSTLWQPKVQAEKTVNLYLGCRFLMNWTNIGTLDDMLDKEFRPVRKISLNQTWPFDDASVDNLFAEEYIEHVNVESGRHIVKEAFRILKPGGVLRIVTKNLEELIQRYASARDCDQFNMEMRNLSYAYSQAHLAHLIGLAGFKATGVVPKNESTKPDLRGLDRDDGDALFCLEAWK